MISENLRGRKIMGGFGNGKRYGSKDTTSSYKRLDIRFLQRKGLLVPGRRGDVNWSRNGVYTANQA
jgi:hypothetical protein